MFGAVMLVVVLLKTNLSQYVGIVKLGNISFVGSACCPTNGSIKTRTEFPYKPRFWSRLICYC